MFPILIGILPPRAPSNVRKQGKCGKKKKNTWVEFFFVLDLASMIFPVRFHNLIPRSSHSSKARFRLGTRLKTSLEQLSPCNRWFISYFFRRQGSPIPLRHRLQVLLQLNDIYVFLSFNSQYPRAFRSSHVMSLSKHFSAKMKTKKHL